MTLPSRVVVAQRWREGVARRNAARVLAVGGVAAYNWWVVVPFVPGLMPSMNGFFSDLEATGRPHAALMAEADLAAALLMLAALLLRGPVAGGGTRREWKWVVAFAGAGLLGGHYSYACSEGLSATCRQLEWQLQLPTHHYIHMLSGIAEFGALTTAAVLAMHRTHHDASRIARVYSGLVGVLAVGYPLLGLVYLTDRLGTLVEPVFLVAFSAMVLAEVFEPIGRPAAVSSWAERVAARGPGPATPEPLRPRVAGEVAGGSDLA